MALTADAAGQALSDAGVVERIVAAVMEQKLPPGAKLPEGALCEAFECSRTQIRRVLVVLAERGVVTLHMNRGAFVKSPNAGEARDVFEARRAIERSIVLSAAARADPTALKELRANVVAGAAAEARGDLPEVDPALGRVSHSSRRGRRQFGPDQVSRRAGRAHLAHHRALRIAQRPLLRGSRTRSAHRRARGARRRASRESHGRPSPPHRARARHSRHRGSTGGHQAGVRALAVKLRGSATFALIGAGRIRQDEDGRHVEKIGDFRETHAASI